MLEAAKTKHEEDFWGSSGHILNNDTQRQRKESSQITTKKGENINKHCDTEETTTNSRTITKITQTPTNINTDTETDNSLLTKNTHLSEPKIWREDSWKDFPIQQQPVYTDIPSLYSDLQTLKNSKLTTTKNIRNLKNQLKNVSTSDRWFVIIAGDCSEPMKESDSFSVYSKCALLNYLSYIIENRFNKKSVLIGRMAGQFAKPRSSDYEIINNSKKYYYLR